MRRPSIPYELLASFAAMRAKRRQEILLAQGALTMPDPRDPTQVPDPMKDDVKEGNPIPSDFNDDEDESDGFDDDEDDEDDED